MKATVRGVALGVLLGVVQGLLLCACASAPPPSGWRAQPSVGDEPVAKSEGAALVPPPPSERAGETPALRLSLETEAARRVALDFVDAVVKGDGQALSLLLDDPITLVAEGARKARREVVASCLDERGRLGYVPEQSVEAVVDVAGIAPEPAASTGEARPLGVAPDDLWVRLPPSKDLRTRGQRLPCLGMIYVKLGAHPSIVALAR